MKMLVESVRSRLQMRRDAITAHPDEWEPVSEESPRRRLSAPTLQLCAVTDVGKCRSNNEDRYFLSAEGRLWIVSDGMGGQAAGEVASALTIQAISESMHAAGPDTGAVTGLCLRDRLVAAFATAQDRVSAHVLKNDGCKGMGCTAIAGVVDGDALHICHVGDVRCYHLSECEFKRLTNDHSWVWEKLVMTGLLTPEQARSHPERGKVTRGIGLAKQSGVEPDLISVTLKPGDRVMLCSDGLWEALGDDEIAAVVGSDGSMRQLASVLVDRANAAGGEDNITVILYEHSQTAVDLPDVGRNASADSSREEE
ncbi:MAG: protein phosphatase 2C domain-containing protein [Bryobacteraceae bacterium]|jgi:protein phosphatase